MTSKVKSIAALLVIAAFGYAPIGAALAFDCNTGHSSARTFNKSVKTLSNTKKKKQSLRVRKTKKKAKLAKSSK